ncbi:MAG: glycosyl hydrolase, partial [Bryobacteraceae bacterium]
QLTERLETDKPNEKSKAVLDKAGSVATELTTIEESLYQTKIRASEDPLNFPVRLNNKLAALLTAVSQADAQPTASQQQVYEALARSVNAQLKKLKNVMSTSVPALNKMVKDQDIPAIIIRIAEPSK